MTKDMSENLEKKNLVWVLIKLRHVPECLIALAKKKLGKLIKLHLHRVIPLGGGIPVYYSSMFY